MKKSTNIYLSVFCSLVIFNNQTIDCHAAEELSLSDPSFSSPSFCEYYDKMYEIKSGNAIQSNGTPYNGSTNIYGQCVSSVYVDIDVNDIIKNWSSVNDSFLANYNLEIRNKANHFALNSLLSKAFEFDGLGNGVTQDLPDDMLLCLGNYHPDIKKRANMERSKEVEKNKELSDAYIDLSFDKSVLITSLFSLRDDIEKKYSDKLKSHQSKSTRTSRRNKRFKIKKDKINEEKNVELEKVYNKLKSLSINSPLLFSTENNFKISDWFNSTISPSSLTTKLAGNIPEPLINKLKQSLGKKSSEEGLISFSEQYNDNEFKKEIQSYKTSHLNKNNKSIKNELIKSSSKFSKEVYDSITDNCKDDGKYLHYNDHIVTSLAGDIYSNDKLSAEDKKIELMSLQAWQCKEWRDHPPAEVGDMTWTRIGGMASMGAGAVLWATAGWTGVGAVAGTWMIAGGGALMTANSVRDYIASKPEYQQQKTAYSLGWRDVESLARSRDQRNDISSDIASDSIGGVGGVVLRYVKLPGKFMNIGEVAENTAKRESDNPIKDINEYTELIFSRHQKVIPENSIVDNLNYGVRRVTGNVEIPKIMLDSGDDFSPMLRQLTSTRGLPEDRNIAFKDLETLVKRYKDYPDRVRSAVRDGRNAKDIIDYNNVYASILKREHFTPNPKTGRYPELPYVDIPLAAGQTSPYKLVRTSNDSIALYYKVVKKNKDGVEEVVDHVEDFNDYNSFLSFVTNSRKDYNRAFSFDVRDEALRRSDIFSELDDQAKMYRELEIVRNQLIKEGKNIDLVTGRYPNLSDRQNDTILSLNSLLKESPDLLPRKDALRAFSLAENKVERRGIVLGNIVKNKGSKYSDDALGMVNEAAPSFIRKIAPIGILPGMSAMTVATSSVLNKTGLRGLKEDILEESRDISRSMNKFLNPNAPIGYTGDEEECAKSARGWSLENACLLALLNNNIMAKAGIREQLEPEYNMTEDTELMGDVRDYIRDIYRLRKYFAEGKKTQIAQSSMSSVGDEVAEEELVKFMRETALENGLTLLDGDFLQDDIANKYRQRLFAYRDNPSDAKQAYDDVLKEFSEYQSSFIQNPEMSVSFKEKIKIMMVDQAKLESEQN